MHGCRNIELDCSIESLRRFKVVVPETRREMIMEYLEKSGVDLFDFREAMEQADNEELIIPPIINGDRLAEVTGLVPGPRLGKLKGWLHRKQIEGALRTDADLIALLSEINWKNNRIMRTGMSFNGHNQGSSLSMAKYSSLSMNWSSSNSSVNVLTITHHASP